MNGTPAGTGDTALRLNGLVDIFRSIIQAAIGLKELQFVLAVGGQLDPKQLGVVPANVRERQKPASGEKGWAGEYLLWLDA